MWPACFRILSTRMVFLALPVCGMPAWAADGFAPPPRSISDVLAALDQYKPDPIAAEKARLLQPVEAGWQGTDSLLVSNWPVETTSARQLIDDPGLVIDGKPAYSYAHPMFWAPFALVGEGANR